MSTDEEPLREPEPEPPSALDRHLRERDRRMPWVRLGILVAALVALLVFYSQIGNTVAGCFGKFVEKPKAGSTPAPAGELQMRIEPARPLAMPDAKPD